MCEFFANQVRDRLVVGELTNNDGNIVVGLKGDGG
jgi:hypothetical protein